MFQEDYVATLKQELDGIYKRAITYLENNKVLPPFQESWHKPDNFNIDEWYSKTVTEPEQREAEILTQNISRVVKSLASSAKSSPLINEADIRDMSFCLKKIRSALFFRQYRHWDTDVIHDEGTVLGVSPASQSEDTPIDTSEAIKIVHSSYKALIKIVDLISPVEPILSPLAISPETHKISKFRPNTAFIMMWINKSKPDLDDVRDTIKEVFSSFGVKAVRADEIEHEDMITKRILDEIATSEFLIADLTGSRPSIYYEVGYAHAIGKRVILYRKEETALHFDLAVHNCPEYRNLGDLKEKLINRLKSITNKEPQG
jgi:hypothetical protein